MANEIQPIAPQQPKYHVVWSPLPGSQSLALTAPVSHILYDGSRGPGKSVCQLMYFRKHVGQGYGAFWRGVIIGKHYKDLDDLLGKSRRWFGQFGDGAKFLSSMSDLKWVWPTGEELLFRHMEKEGDYSRYHGQEFSFIGFNELTLYPTSACYDLMMSCNRSSFIPREHTPKDKFGRYKTRDGKPLPEIPLTVFSTTNPHGCVPFGDVLTESRGWVDIRKIEVGERVVTVDRSGVAKIGIVSAVTRAQWDGKMLLRKGRGLHIEFTPTHRFPHFNTDETEHTVKRFNELPGQAAIRRSSTEWAGEHVDEIMGHNAGDFMELLGWFISEGCMIKRRNESERNSFQIAQMKTETRLRIQRLLERMGLHFRSDSKGFVVTNARLADLFREQGKCRNKHIPARFLRLSRPLLERLMESLLLGDGCGQVYYTISRQLADDFSALSIRCGYSVYQTSRQRKNRVGLSYEISCKKCGALRLVTGNHAYSVGTKNSCVNVSSNEFSGEVFCLTIPDTETFFIRQNGCVWLSGNSGHNWVKRRFIDPAPAGKVVRKTTRVFNPRTQQEEDFTKTQVRIFGSYKENKFLSPEYVSDLMNITDPNLRAAWLEGSWDITAGGAFDDLWRDSIHVLPRFQIPKNWRVVRSLDWGSSHPFSVGFWAISNGEEVEISPGKNRSFTRGTLIRISEIYGSCIFGGERYGHNRGRKISARQLAKEVREEEVALASNKWIQCSVAPGPADNQIFNVTEGESGSIASLMEKEGVRWERSDKAAGSRKNGLELFRAALEASKTGEGPGFFVMRNCEAFLNTVPSLPRDEKNPDDVDSSAEDHVFDEVRYMVLDSKPIYAGSVKVKFAM